MKDIKAKVEALAKKVYSAKSEVRNIVTEVMKEKGTHTFSEFVTRGHYQLLGEETPVYFKTAEYKGNGRVYFECVDLDGEEMTIDFDEFEQDDMTFFDIVYDIIGIK